MIQEFSSHGITSIYSNETFPLFFSFQCLGNLCMPKNNNKQFKQTFLEKGREFLRNFEREGTGFKKTNGTRRPPGRRRRTRG